MSRRKRSRPTPNLICPRCGNTYIVAQGEYYQCKLNPKHLNTPEYRQALKPFSHNCGFFGTQAEFIQQKPP